MAAMPADLGLHEDQVVSTDCFYAPTSRETGVEDLDGSGTKDPVGRSAAW
jgi:hypothetical protein